MQLSKLKYNEINPRNITDSDLDRLKAKLEKYPKFLSLRPIVYDPTTMQVLGGNQRLKGLRQLGFKEVPDDWVKSASDLTEEEKKAFIVIDNKSDGTWDQSILEENWDTQDLEEWGLDISFETDGLDDSIEVAGKEEPLNIPYELANELHFGDEYMVLIFDTKEQLIDLQEKLNLQTVIVNNYEKKELNETGVKRVLRYTEIENHLV